MISFERYVRPSSTAEAYELNQSLKNIAAGGMMWTHLAKGEYDTLIDLCDLGLDRIEKEEGWFRTGSMVTLGQLERSEVLREYYGDVFEDCLKHIVGVQFRNCATLGGSICARLAFSDVLTLLLPMGAELEFFDQGRIRLEDFLKQKNRRDILTHVLIPRKKTKAVFRSVRRNFTDLPIINMCAVFADGETKLAVGSRPGIATLVKEDEEIVFGSDRHASKEYRTHLYEVLKKQIREDQEEGQ